MSKKSTPDVTPPNSSPKNHKPVCGNSYSGFVVKQGNPPPTTVRIPPPPRSPKK